jgi:D-3-phosphoglycerate dehydrogenase
MGKIILSESIHESGLNMLKAQHDVEIVGDTTEEVLKQAIKDAQALIVRSSTVTSTLISAGSNLRVIGRHGIGVDNIDIPFASKNGVLVVNTPDANTISVAEYTIAAMLYVSKRLYEADRALRGGVFIGPGSLPGMVTRLGYTAVELHGKEIGLLGFGRIARRVALICHQCFGMQVCSYDEWIPNGEIEKCDVRPCRSLEEVFAGPDFVSIHIPLTPETQGLVGLKQLTLMKPSSVLINTARGGVVVENDLAQVLKVKKIAAAVIDVFECEPPGINDALFKLDNVLVTPHMAAMTDGALRRMSCDVAAGVLSALAGKKPENLVNPEIWVE